MMMIIGVLYLSKTTTYKLYSTIDYSIYAFLRNIPLHINIISRIYNLSVFSFYITSVIFITVIYTTKRIILSVLACIPAVAFIIINDYTITWDLFLKLHINAESTINLLEIIKIFNVLCMIFYILMPIVCLCIECMRSKIYIYKRYTLIAMLNIILIDAFFLKIFVYGAFESIWVNNVKITKFPSNIDALGLNLFLPISVLMLLLISIVITVFIKPFRYSVFRQNSSSALKYVSLQKNIRYTFHAYKNSIMCIEKYVQLIKLCLKSNNTEEISKYADDILNIITETTSSLSRDIHSMKKIRLNRELFSITDCINKTIAKLHAGDIVSVNYPDNQELFIRGDEKYISECFHNIIKNSLEATANKDDGHINVTIYSERNILYAEITDNGCGIEKNELKYIFNEFYTTKSRTKGSGIGLSFSKKVIESHNGYISVKSEPGKYTTTKIVLPVSSRQ